MNLIEFANPIGWWWAALALPIVAFYMLRVRLRRQPVSTMRFWDQVFEEKKPRAWWQRLRHWLSLLLQLALLLLLVGALVDPLWSGQKNQRRQWVVIVDNSASMAAMEAGQSRFDRAKRTAAAVTRSLRVGDEMAILTTGGSSAVAIGLTGHLRSLLETIERIELTDAPNSLFSAVEMAKRLVPPSKQSKRMLLTDGCDAALENLQQSDAITVYGLGTPQDNLAITQFQVRRSLLDAIGYQVLVEVSNLGEQAQKLRLELHLEGELVDVIPLELEKGAAKILNLDHASATGGRLVAQIDATDGLAIDNRALAILPTRRQMPITLATPGSVFLKSVLASIPLVDLNIVEAPPENWAPADDGILVLHQRVPKKLPAGKLLIINPRNDCDLWTLGQPIEKPLVGSVATSSPVTQHIRLTNVLFPDARALTFTGANEALIKTPLDEPLLSYIHRPAGDVLILNVDLDLGDLPLRIAFPVLMKNAVEWFQGRQGELNPAFATGRPAKVPLPSIDQVARRVDVSSDPSQEKSQPESAISLEVVKQDEAKSSTADFMLRSPAGDLTPLARAESTALLSMLNYCGLWTIGTKAALQNDPWINAHPASKSIASDDPRLVHVACNLCSRAESDLRPRLELESPNNFGVMSLGGNSIWFYLALASLVLVVVEWWLYQRRVVG